jgi:NTP pyrophosphatase (non-canonical NTP hydrolase)
MTFNDYQKDAKSTRAYPEYGQATIGAIAYCALGLAGEAGEVANKVKKLLRDGDTPELRIKILDEMGDVLWYAAILADELGTDLNVIALDNLKKLRDRKRNATIRGEGDAR